MRKVLLGDRQRQRLGFIMSIWTELARASNNAGDEILLRRRNDIYEIRYNGIELMSNINFQSETILAERSLRLLGRTPKKVLIGGLGMGFTLRAALNYLPNDTEVTVCEFVPEIVDWNRSVIGSLACFPLQDNRVKIHIGDVMETLRQHESTYDLILMDTDNGPEFLVRSENNAIYDGCGLTAIKRALTPTGIASFWSANASLEFEKKLSKLSWHWSRQDICLIGGRSDAFHYIYFANKISPAIDINRSIASDSNSILQTVN
jgi:spermidine synthase